MFVFFRHELIKEKYEYSLKLQETRNDGKEEMIKEEEEEAGKIVRGRFGH